MQYLKGTRYWTTNTVKCSAVTGGIIQSPHPPNWLLKLRILLLVSEPDCNGESVGGFLSNLLGLLKTDIELVYQGRGKNRASC